MPRTAPAAQIALCWYFDDSAARQHDGACRGRVARGPAIPHCSNGVEKTSAVLIIRLDVFSLVEFTKHAFARLAASRRQPGGGNAVEFIAHSGHRRAAVDHGRTLSGGARWRNAKEGIA